jgi:hypothetical protein
MRYRFSFEWARGSNSDISLVSCPNDIKFWQMISLTSGLIWYFITKVGFFLKKTEFLLIFQKTARGKSFFLAQITQSPVLICGIFWCQTVGGEVLLTFC